MTLELWLAFGGLFVSIALITGLGASNVLAGMAPERRRLREMAVGAGGQRVLIDQIRLTDDLSPRMKTMAAKLPKSPKEMGRLRRRMATAGIYSFGAAMFYTVAELALPVLFASVVLSVMRGTSAWMTAAAMAAVGYMIPSLVLSRLIKKRQQRIENGLPDALDLIIVCVEAGCSLDQGILKTTEELELAHPDLASEMRNITTEVRAGKPRIEAFKNFAARTKVDDVRALVAMLVQTDRFGTSIAQALRTHAVTSRQKRRQRAEERAAKVGVKLVFPLVFFLFPAFYVVTLGPAVILFIRSSFFAGS
jgi:tight adherence protein C